MRKRKTGRKPGKSRYDRMLAIQLRTGTRFPLKVGDVYYERRREDGDK